MGTLMFECPATGMEVSTGIEVDTASFESLSPLTADLPCPHCPTPPDARCAKMAIQGNVRFARRAGRCPDCGLLIASLKREPAFVSVETNAV
jgi:hypothetical protein